MMTIMESKTVVYNTALEFAERLPQTLYGGWTLAKVKVEKSGAVKVVFNREIIHEDKERG